MTIHRCLIWSIKAHHPQTAPATPGNCLHQLVSNAVVQHIIRLHSTSSILLDLYKVKISNPATTHLMNHPQPLVRNLRGFTRAVFTVERANFRRVDHLPIYHSYMAAPDHCPLTTPTAPATPHIIFVANFNYQDFGNMK